MAWHDDVALKAVDKMDWLRLEQPTPVRLDPNWTGERD